MAAVADVAEGPKNGLVDASFDLDHSSLICGNCNEHYLPDSSPEVNLHAKLLACLHTYCMGCLERNAKAEGNEIAIVCPKCNNTTFLDMSKGLDGLQTDFSVQHLLEAIAAEDVQGAEVPLCGNCEEVTQKPGKWGCMECQVALCDSCADTHAKVKAFRNHQVVSVTSYMSRVRQAQLALPAKCPRHDKNIEFCCEICYQALCATCVIMEHSGHRMITLHEAADIERNRLRTLMDDVNSNMASILADRGDLQERINWYESIVSSLKSRVDVDIDEMIAVLEQRRIEAHDEIEQRTSFALKTAREELDSLSNQLDGAQGCVETMERALHYGNDFDIYGTSPLFQMNLLAKSQHKSTAVQLGPVDIVSSRPVIADLHRLVRRACNVQSAVTPALSPECQAGIIGNRAGTGLGDLLNPHGIALLLPAPGRCVDPLLFVADRSNDRVQVFDAVSGAFMHVIGRGTGSGPGQFNGPYSVALLTPFEGNPLLFVADYGNNRIQVFDSITGSFVYEIGGGAGSEPGQLNGPFRIALETVEVGSTFNPLLYVTDYGNHRVQVFDAITGEHVHIIGAGPGTGPGQLNGPLAISLQMPPQGSDDDAELFVGDNGNCRIQVFNAVTGSLIRVLGNGLGRRPGQLNGIYGLTTQVVHQVDSGDENAPTSRLFVADFNNHRVQVFDGIKGTLLHVIGSGQGEGLGEMSFPSDVLVYERADGVTVMFVAEQTNNRIQVFTLK